MEAGAAIQIAISSENDLLKLRIKAPGQHHLTLPLKPVPAKLAELRMQLADGLREFVAILAQNGRIDKAPDVGARAMRQLYNVGSAIGSSLFGALLDDAVDYFRIAAPGWANFGQPGFAPPSILLDGAFEHPLPLEFIPMFDPSSPECSESGGIIGMAARFPVFSTLFCRNPMNVTRAFKAARDGSPGPSDIIENGSQLLIRLFANQELEAAAVERQFFQGAQGAALRGPWPDSELRQPAFIADLSERLYGPARPDEPFHPAQDNVQHFICHCDTGGASPDHALLLAHRGAGIFKLRRSTRAARIHELQTKALTYPRNGRPSPLVFLNACGSSKITPEGVTSFPDHFLEEGSCGVIGTEAAVPDLAAAEFARVFYTELMAGKSLGEALYEARAGLLRRFNPIGAIYSAYALPGLRLRNPVSLESADR